ncbi:MAG: K(+)-transporting ATPase subunit F [Pseudomonadota bacterium]|nr:K(+)-transporting ATPase subunit F [Pseudomonadota bacterium]
MYGCAGLLAVGLIAYLLYVLVRPEEF